MPIPTPPGVDGEKLGHHAASSPGLYTWHGVLTEDHRQIQVLGELQILLVPCIEAFIFLERIGSLFPKALSILQGILSSFSSLVSTQTQDLWCLVTLPFLLFIASNGHHSLFGRPL